MPGIWLTRRNLGWGKLRGGCRYRVIAFDRRRRGRHDCQLRGLILNRGRGVCRRFFRRQLCRLRRSIHHRGLCDDGCRWNLRRRRWLGRFGFWASLVRIRLGRRVTTRFRGRRLRRGPGRRTLRLRQNLAKRWGRCVGSWLSPLGRGICRHGGGATAGKIAEVGRRGRHADSFMGRACWLARRRRRPGGPAASTPGASFPAAVAAALLPGRS